MLEPQTFYELQWTSNSNGKLILEHDLEPFFQNENYANLPKFTTPQSPIEEESMEIDSIDTLEEELARAPQSTQKHQAQLQDIL